MYEHVVVEYQNRKHSTAQSPLHKAANQIRTSRPDYVSKIIITFMRRPGCFSRAWSSWHLQVDCLHLKCWTIYYICHSNPFFLVSERSGRNRPLREAPCTTYLVQQLQYPSSQQTTVSRSFDIRGPRLPAVRRTPVEPVEPVSSKIQQTADTTDHQRCS